MAGCSLLLPDWSQIFHENVNNTERSETHDTSGPVPDTHVVHPGEHTLCHDQSREARCAVSDVAQSRVWKYQRMEVQAHQPVGAVAREEAGVWREGRAAAMERGQGEAGEWRWRHTNVSGKGPWEMQAKGVGSV